MALHIYQYFLTNNFRGGRKINGIIYLHRISDPRVGRAVKKNLRVFRELCGNDVLDNVCLVTTNWDSVDQSLGSTREAELANNLFKLLIDGGAKTMRHDKGLVSAESIISTLVHKAPVTLKIQTELNEGKTLGDTSAGSVIIEEMKVLQKKQGEELADLLKQIQKAATSSDDDLRADLAKDRQKLQQLMERADQDQMKWLTLYPSRGLPPAVPQAQASPRQVNSPTDSSVSHTTDVRQGSTARLRPPHDDDLRGYGQKERADVDGLERPPPLPQRPGQQIHESSVHRRPVYVAHIPSVPSDTNVLPDSMPGSISMRAKDVAVGSATRVPTPSPPPRQMLKVPQQPTGQTDDIRRRPVIAAQISPDPSHLQVLPDCTTSSVGTRAQDAAALPPIPPPKPQTPKPQRLPGAQTDTNSIVRGRAVNMQQISPGQLDAAVQHASNEQPGSRRDFQRGTADNNVRAHPALPSSVSLPAPAVPSTPPPTSSSSSTFSALSSSNQARHQGHELQAPSVATSSTRQQPPPKFEGASMQTGCRHCAHCAILRSTPWSKKEGELAEAFENWVQKNDAATAQFFRDIMKALEASRSS